MIILKLFGIIILFIIVAFLITNYLDKQTKRKFLYLLIIGILGYIINTGALIYDLIKSGNNISLDYFIALVKGGQYTASFLVFEDNFSSLGLLTNYIWFKVIYYVFLSLAYILYSITLITLISYKTMSKLRMFFIKKDKVYCFTSLNSKSLKLASSIKEKFPNASIVFTLMSFAPTDENQEQLKILKDNRYMLYTAGQDKEDEQYLKMFPLIKKFNSIYVFCLSESSELNIEFCKNYATEKIEIYALTEEEFSGSIYLYKNNIHIIKQHDLTAKMLIMTKPCYNTIYEDKDGKEMNVLILGRGRSGNAIFKNIFVSNQFKNVKLNITVFDLKDRDGFYKLQYPGIYNFNNIKFINVDIYSSSFIEKLSNYIKRNNYIVVALGDDKKNIEIANILYIYSLTKSNCNASIYCHVREEKNKTLLQNAYKENVTISSFGLENQVFSYDIVVGEFMDRFAKSLNDYYNQTNPKNAVQWNELSEFTKSSNRSVWLAAGAKLFTLGLEIVDINDPRPEFDFNTLSEDEKLLAAQEEHLRWNAFHIVNGWTRLTIEEAKTYEQGKKIRKIEEKKKSLSLVDWDELDDVSKYLGEDVKSYDFLWQDALKQSLKAVGKKAVKK